MLQLRQCEFVVDGESPSKCGSKLHDMSKAKKDWGSEHVMY